MKILVRIGLALGVLAVAAAVAIAIALPRLIQSEDARERIEQAARDATGRALHFDELDVGLLPPSLRIVGPRLSGETADDPPIVEAREVSLQIALLPLLLRTVLIDALVVESGTLRLERTSDGLVLPKPAPTEGAETSGGSGGAATEGPEEAASPIDLAVRSVRLRDSRLQLVDRSVRPAATWDFTDLDAEAAGRSLDAPIDVALSADVATGGSIDVSGTATRHGDVALDVSLDAFGLAPVAPYLGGDAQAAGRLTGGVALQGPVDALSKLTVDVRGDEIRFQQGDVALRGRVTVEADVANPTGAAEGRFEIDATDAELGFGGGFAKPPGTVAEVTGRVVGASDGGYAFEDVRLRIKNLDATGRVSSLDPLRVEASAAPFDIAGWEALLPALAESSPRGRLGFTELRFDASPMRLRGALDLQKLALGGASKLVLHGKLLAEGTSIRTAGATLDLNGEAIEIDATLSDLFGTPRHRIATKATDADSNRLVSALFSKSGAIEGPLDLDLALSGNLGADLRSSLTGRIDFGVTPGRLVDVSILKLVVAQLGSVGTLAAIAGQAFSGNDLERYYGDRFEEFRGLLEVGGGRARTKDLTVRYPEYGVVLRGALDLENLGLDMKGDLTLGEKIDASIARSLGIKDYEARPRVLSLASVRGTLDEPEVSLSSAAVTSLLSAYGTGTYEGKLREKVEETLQDLLKTRRKPESDPAPPSPEPPPEPEPRAEAPPEPAPPPEPASEPPPVPEPAPEPTETPPEPRREPALLEPLH